MDLVHHASVVSSPSVGGSLDLADWSDITSNFALFFEADCLRLLFDFGTISLINNYFNLTFKVCLSLMRFYLKSFLVAVNFETIHK